MTKSHKKHMEKRYPSSDVYFQSAEFNERQYQLYRQWMFTLALNRFRWVNLPASCNERYLEISLFYNGVATIAHPKKLPGVFYSTQAAPTQQPNVYDNPISWESIGNNGWHFKVSRKNGVIVYENRQRLPIADKLDLFARRLTAIDRTLDINMLQQRTPFVFTAPQEKKLDLANVLKQWIGGEPAIVGFDQIDELININAIATAPAPIADEIVTAKSNIWQDIYHFLGIRYATQKSERMNAEEVDVISGVSDLMALDPLTARREACEEFNRRFQPDKPLQVFWREDFESDTYNFERNVEKMNEIGGIGKSV